MTLATPPGRHTIVRVRADAAGADALGLEEMAAPLHAYARAWIAAGRPLVVRRPCRDAAGRLCCGLPTPPGDGKLRLALSLAPAAVLSLEPPPLLTDCLTMAPASWRPALDRLAKEAVRLALAPLRVYGSLAWQFLTGLDYLGPDSDADVLAEVTRRSQLAAIVAALAAWEGRAGLRCDAEIRLPGGACFSWREYAAMPRKVLVKTDGAVFLAMRQALSDGLPH